MRSARELEPFLPWADPTTARCGWHRAEDAPMAPSARCELRPHPRGVRHACTLRSVVIQWPHPPRRDVEVCRGITRTVLLIGRWAVKVPSLRPYKRGLRGLLWSVTRGIQANLSEIDWSGTDGVCPVLWSFGGIVNVYPRCEPVDSEHAVDWEAMAFTGPTDRKNENVGWLDGELVVIDYDMSWNDCPHGVSVEDESP